MNAGAPLRFDVVPVKTPADGPLAVELVPAPDPWEVAKRLAHLPHLLFLDSAERHDERGRYSYVSASPQGFGRGHRRSLNTEPFILERLDLKRLHQRHAAGLPPFQGGIAGHFGYGLGHSFEKIPETRYDEFEFPDVGIASFDWVVSFDHVEGRAWVISTGFPEAKRGYRQV